MKSFLFGFGFLSFAIVLLLCLQLWLHPAAPQPLSLAPSQSAVQLPASTHPVAAPVPQGQTLPPAFPAPQPMSIDPRLAEAIRLANLDDVAALLRAAPDVNAADGEGNTALHLAAKGCREAIVAAVLAAGPDVNRRNRAGQTPLFVAVSARVTATEPSWARLSDETVLVLLGARGLDPNVADREGRTPPQLASEHPALDPPRSPHYHPAPSTAPPHNPGLGDLLVMHGAKDSPDLAILRGNRVAAEVLLRAGGGVDVPGREGRTPLMAAAIVGDTELLRDLVRRSANTGAHMARGLTPLMVAAEAGRSDSIQVLLELGADSNQVADDQSAWPEHFRGEMTPELAERVLSDPRSGPHVRAGLLLAQGGQLLESRDTARMEEFLRQAATVAPKSRAGMNAAIRLSHMLAKQGKFKAAAEAMEPLVAISPAAPPGQLPGPGVYDPRHDYCYYIATWYSRAGEPAKALPYARLARDTHKYSPWCGTGYVEHLAAVDALAATLEKQVAGPR